jgi:hypothetical protein
MSGTIAFIVFIIAGSFAVLYGRTLPTAVEEERKEGWREWLYGPPGYYRASTIFLGLVVTLIGIMGLIIEVFSSSE